MHIHSQNVTCLQLYVSYMHNVYYTHLSHIHDACVCGISICTAQPVAVQIEYQPNPAAQTKCGRYNPVYKGKN